MTGRLGGAAARNASAARVGDVVRGGGVTRTVGDAVRAKGEATTCSGEAALVDGEAVREGDLAWVGDLARVGVADREGVEPVTAGLGVTGLGSLRERVRRPDAGASAGREAPGMCGERDECALDRGGDVAVEGVFGRVDVARRAGVVGVVGSAAEPVVTPAA